MKTKLRAYRNPGQDFMGPQPTKHERRTPYTGLEQNSNLVKYLYVVLSKALRLRLAALVAHMSTACLERNVNPYMYVSHGPARRGSIDE